MDKRQLSEVNLPEPVEEFDSERRQAYFDLGAAEAVDIKWRLLINELIAALGAVKDTLGADISELLWNFCYRRSYRLTWLKQQAWGSDSLLRFLEFLDCWESNPDWWETYFYDRRLAAWRPTWNRSSLSLDSCYSLIQLRHGYTAEEVIDPEWFEDWQKFELWVQGYPSFVSFAIFRAGLRSNDDWRRRIEWIRRHEESAEQFDDYLEQAWQWPREKYCTLSEWFTEQDWYSPSEWHDNLGL